MKKLLFCLLFVVMLGGTSLAANVPSLEFPLTTTQVARTNIGTWFPLISVGRTPKTNKYVGFLYTATANELVFASESGEIKQLLSTPSLAFYPNYVVIEHKDENGEAYTTFYNYINPDSNLSIGSIVVKGQIIGTIQDFGASSRLFFSVRNAPFNQYVSRVEYLPVKATSVYPAFQEKFIIPKFE